MEIAFIVPPIPYRFAKTPYPSLGVGYMAAVLRERCEWISRCELIDGQVLPPDEYQRRIRSLAVDVVLISATIRQLKGAKDAAREIRRSNPGMTTVLGGPGPSSVVDLQSLDRYEVDIIAKGECEDILPILLDHLRRGEAPTAVPNLLIRHQGSPMMTPCSPARPEVTKLPWPDRALFDEQAYLDRWRQSAGMTSVHIMGSRGCPFSCGFCDLTVTGRRVRYREADDIVAEMMFLEQRYSPDDIFYFDDLFTINKKRVLAICRLIRERGLKTSWSAQGRVDVVDAEMLQAMVDAGCQELNFGVESGSPRILEKLAKGTTREEIIRAFDLCHEVGIQPGAYIIIGVPGETQEDLDATASLIDRIEPGLLEISFLTPYPNTKMFDETKHLIGSWDYEDWDDLGGSIYDFQFAVDPVAARDQILEAFRRKVAGGMKHLQHQFANDDRVELRIPRAHMATP
jgi:anaerobic magnesium-protoporphyrin IX monomethyl ester cyclase